MKTETIKHAAMKSENGMIFIGKCHADCAEKMFYLSLKPSVKAKDQGFITNLGNFVDRFKGASIALAANQINGNHILFSEYLWDKEYNGKFDYDEIKGYIERT